MAADTSQNVSCRHVAPSASAPEQDPPAKGWDGWPGTGPLLPPAGNSDHLSPHAWGSHPGLQPDSLSSAPPGGLGLCKDKELLWEQSDSGIPFFFSPFCFAVLSPLLLFLCLLMRSRWEEMPF
uniref:Uncharacterized protein n=1 Tax=Aquila chrysaetos chrysaetos TaxID=223781 RepID=A0A663F6W3_AQUCH